MTRVACADVYTTPDDRVLGYDDVGDRSGHPVVYLHGTPDSRRARHPDDGLATEAGVRLLAVDRPGYGTSSPPAEGSSALQVHERFARDLAALLDELVVDRVSLLAWSGGTLQSLALAAALALDHRVEDLTIVAGVVPREAYDDPAVAAAAPDRLGLVDLADQLSPDALAEMVAPMMAPFPCTRALAAEHQREHRSAGDQATLAGVPGALDLMATALAEAVRHGLAGVAADVAAQNYPGSLPSFDQVDVPVRLFYGSDDQVTPPAFGRWYAERLAYAELHTIAGAGHTVFLTHWREILADVTGSP